MKKFDKILLFSGGLDSLAAWYKLGKPQTLYFATGSRYSQREQDAVLKLIPNTIIDSSLNLSLREQEKNAYIPFRNLLFAAQAVHYSDNIIIGGIQDDRVSDKSPSAFQSMSNTLTELEHRPITVTSPFWHWSKVKIVKYLSEIYSIKELLYDTISCYAEDCDSNYCGECPSCFRKWCALMAHTDDVILFYNTSLMLDYYKKACDGEYTSNRNESIKYAVEAYRKHLATKQIVIDIDGIIFKDLPEGVWDYSKCVPLGVADNMMELRASGYILHLFTSRLKQDAAVTVDCLNRYGIPYDYITYEKPLGVMYIDDKSTDNWEKLNNDLL